MATQKIEFTVKNSLAKLAAIMLTLALLLSVVAPAMAREAGAAQGGYVSTAPSQGQGPTDAAEMEAFMDDLLTRQMEENHIAVAIRRFNRQEF